MTRLEDLYDVPPLQLRMIGGPRGGETVYVPWPEPPHSFRFPVPVDMTQHIVDFVLRNNAYIPTTAMPIDTYVFTGHIDDDGCRLYQYDGRH